MTRLLAAVLVLALGACRAPDQGDVVAPVVERRQAEVGFPDGSRLKVELAETAEERERGLMFRASIGPEEGMLFVFENDGALAFWMKNTFIDLDMAWLDAKGKVTVLHENVPRSTPGMKDDEVATRAGHGLYVLELAAGQAARRKIAVGSVLSLARPGAPAR